MTLPSIISKDPLAPISRKSKTSGGGNTKVLQAFDDSNGGSGGGGSDTGSGSRRKIQGHQKPASAPRLLSGPQSNNYNPYAGQMNTGSYTFNP
ncbi:hypothetical protein PPL_09695 [Heterostelium album PN500]|uniref:Uncharacterized protein n=1 Tax=Heterostelium pallidum (strain ATCC 26659 / Pp 5 / PN500) TaxID=670386 RepID=D3BNJ2_HETP5|nr:hypothetical protein PPL_09695 [Heterostelium album PN500]EFA76943.1 hypothetical protein PPL_09695 [Heterostelium album PN500]|eukprot:XP_020429075.1 hypothetical protein PPL_09695 [Heterostelium album PN500]